MRSQAKAAGLAALAEYIAAVPIGGEKVARVGIVSRKVLIAFLVHGSRTSRVDGVVDVALSAVRADVQFGATQVPVLEIRNLTWTEV